MRRPAFRPALALILGCALLLAIPASALAGWESDYKAGKEAYEEGKAQEAVRHLRAAIGRKSEEKANAIKASGMFFDPYLPHFYLGLALFQLERYQAALEELETSESMGVVQKYEALHAQLRQTKPLARAAAAAAAREPERQEPPPEPPTIASKPEPPEAKPETVAEAKPPDASPDEGAEAAPPAGSGTGPDEGPRTATPEPLKPSHPKPQPPPGPDPALVQARNAAAGDLAAAAKLRVEGDRYLDAQEKARLDTLAREVRDAETAAAATSKQRELRGLIDQLGSKIEDQKAAEAQRAREAEEQQRRVAENRALKEAADRAAPTLRRAESFMRESGPSLQGAERRSLDGAISTVRNAKTPQTVGSATERLDSELARVRKALSDRVARAQQTARRRFSDGARAYFEGRYDEAVPALSEAGATLTEEAGLQALLGCALYKRYLLGRSQDDSLLEEAERAFRAALAIDSRYTLEEDYFPPKVIAFFRQVAGSPAR